MIRNFIAATLTVGFVAGLGLTNPSTTAKASEKTSPYVEYQDREIKSLSREQISKYLSGHGMAIALTGELNHYPAPRDSLDLEQELKLSQKQRRQTRLIYERLRADSIKYGTFIVNREKELNALFASQKAQPKKVHALVMEIARLKGELRYAHLKYHMAMKNILSREQVASYDRLRGYRD